MSPPPHTPPVRTVAGLTLLMLVTIADGFDSAALSLAIPTLSGEWSVPPQALTGALVATSVGAVIGFMASGIVAHRWNRRTVIAASVVLFSLGSIVTAFVGSPTAMAAVRFVVGIGFGFVLPAAISLGVGLVSAARQSATGVGLTLGLGVGTSVAGAAGSGLLGSLGWPALFWLPGAIALVLAVLVPLVLPTDDAVERQDPAAGRVSVGALFAEPVRTATLVVWAFGFITFVATFALLGWAPSLLVQLGFTATEAPIGTALIGLGGLVGGLLVVALAPRLGTPVALVGTSLLAAFALGVAGLSGATGGEVLLAFGLAGGGLIAGTTGQVGLAVGAYAPHLRTTGVGWAAALGRIGSVAGPALGGLLLALDVGPRSFLILVGLPMLVSAALVLELARRGRRVPLVAPPAAEPA
ncbi:MFS transporter [Pseudonocardia sp. ICBG1122]|nr:MFS transporter [Pseudonocardia pini]